MNKLSLVVALVGVWCASIQAQTFTVLTELSPGIEETSGLLHLNGRLLTHNDSGGSPKLYEIDTTSGEVLNEVSLNGATLIDWEDICADEDDIFVGDFGNNLGQRRDLKVYKVARADYLDGDASAEAIALPFRYADQTDFEPAPFQTNFDAETLLAYGDRLLIFSKNWGDGKTRIYAIEKDVMTEQALRPLATIDVNGLLTGGVYDAERQVIMLTGYQNFIPFILEMQVDGSLDFDSFVWQRSTLQTQGGSTQIEGISLAPSHRYYLSGERTAFASSTLYAYAVVVDTTVVSVNRVDQLEQAISVFPNPAVDLVCIQGEAIDRIELLDASGKRVLVSKEKQLRLAGLARGTYTIWIFDSNGWKHSRILLLE